MSDNINQNELDNVTIEVNNKSLTSTNKIASAKVENSFSTVYVATPLKKQANESKERKIIRENYGFFGLVSILYAMFYTFCVYKNQSGITVPLLEIGTIYYYLLVFKKLEIHLKRNAAFYIVSIMLLGISICLTDDMRLIMLSKLGIMILFMSFMLHHFYEDSKWSIGKYLESLTVLAIYTIVAICDPFTDAIRTIQARQKWEKGKLKYIIIGIAITIPLIFIIMTLLLSADRIFYGIFENLINELLVLNNLFTIMLMIACVYVVLYSFINAVAKREIKKEVTDRRTQEPIIAITCSAIISAVYILFCGIQVIGLFLGQLKLPDGYTYAQYAREGFFQLLFVCGMNLVMVLCCMAFFRENKILKMLLTIISVCTYIMVASSAYRMILYISVYQLTFLRIFVLWALFVIALLLLGIVVSIYKAKFPLFRYSLIVVTVLYIGLAFSHPDYFVASYYVNSIKSDTYTDNFMTAYEEREDYDNYGDLYYITSLSADAAPALVQYKSESTLVTAYFKDLKNKSEKMGIRNFNLARYIAGKLAKQDMNQ